jgi:lipopolysaccharide/colanic/teichoic acid biosynthesis glycosyltransferase
LFFPLFAAIAVCIKLGDGGPVFFRQQRVGQNGRLFRIWKFRTMRQGAHKMGPQITRRGDTRITIIGRALRAWKLDEIPQLLNVVLGEMSFVGPRPEVPSYVALYSEEQREVLKLRPGITDLASLEFKDEEILLASAEDPEKLYRDYCIPRKIQLNLEYAQHASIGSDIKLIACTIGAVSGLFRKRCQ